MRHEVECGLKGDAALECRRHVAIMWVAGVLPIDDFSHALQGLQYLLAIDDAVTQPVGDVLRRNTQGGAILH
ncbi:hypothetical protein D3C83_128900 [compost metagenome]